MFTTMALATTTLRAQAERTFRLIRLFVDTTWYELSSGSTCVDAGNPSSSYNDEDGSRNDLGAYGGPYGSW